MDRATLQDWASIERSLDEDGNAVLPGLLTPAQCLQLAALYPREEGFRSRVVMARHGFGQGEYKYFAYPLPPLLDELRHALYPRLVPIANRWNDAVGTRGPLSRDPGRVPRHAATAPDRRRPTPLMLRYGEGDYNCLHQDLYGEHVFPLQAAILLSQPGADFTGGEFVMTETRAGAASEPTSFRFARAMRCVFAVNQRPVPARAASTRRSTMRHGVSRFVAGHRHTVGVIFHDAR